jgi:hypothetical protein
MASVNFNPAVNLVKAANVKTVAPQITVPTPEPTQTIPADGLNINFSKVQDAPVDAQPQQVQSEAVATPAPQTPLTLTTNIGTSVQASSNGTLIEFAPEIDALRSVRPGDLNFDDSAPVISSAKKFILPAPNFPDGGEPLVYPEGTKNAKGEDVGGKPLVDYKGDPIGDKGVVFFNPKDQSWEGVAGDGSGVVILNQLDEKQTQAVFDKVDSFGGDPTKLSIDQYKEVLSAATEAGANDLYHSDRGFIKSKMNPLESSSTGIPEYGLFRRDDRDICQVLFLDGKGEFTGTATTHQFEDGAAIVRQANAKTEGGFDYRLIQPEVFAETYSNKDGSKINLDALPRG